MLLVGILTDYIQYSCVLAYTLGQCIGTSRTRTRTHTDRQACVIDGGWVHGRIGLHQFTEIEN